MLTYDKYCVYRDKKKMSDYNVSLLTGIGNSTFSEWKQKKYNPSLETQLKIAKVLNIPVKEIVSKADIENAQLKPKTSNKDSG